MKMALKKERNVLLFIDQYATHTSDYPLLTYARVIFFPENCTNRIWLLDLGIIRSVKVQNQKALVQRMFISLELKTVWILNANYMLISTCNNGYYHF